MLPAPPALHSAWWSRHFPSAANSAEKQLLLVPFSESEELLGVSRPGYSLHCSPLCELSFRTLLL